MRRFVQNFIGDKKVSFTIFLFLVSTFFSCKKELDGKFTWEEWKMVANWNENYARPYFLHEPSIDSLKKYNAKKPYKYIIVAGSWCSDSHVALTQLYKIFESTDIHSEQIELYAVSRNKKDTKNFTEKFHILKVPTLIIHGIQGEIGRIVESPKGTWEGNIYKLLKNDK